MTNKHTIGDLRQMQSLPLQAKIQMTRQRIRAWIDEFGEDGVYVSFSGGKDSTVLLDIVRKDYPSIEAVFVNTGLEYPSVRQFALSKENVTELRPTMNFRDVIIKYGYPIISKNVSHNVSIARRNPNGNVMKNIFDPNKKGQYAMFRYSYLLSAPFLITDKCCDITKKKPLKKIEKEKKPIIATMAEESTLRKDSWLHNGCNAFDMKNPQSRPMSFWTENDVLQYIYENKLDIAKQYGTVLIKPQFSDTLEGQINISDLLSDYRGCDFCTNGCRRTGCIFCVFGITQDKDRFINLSEEEPKLCDYVMRGGEFWYKVFNKNGFEIKLKHCSHKQIEKWCIDNSSNENFKIDSVWQPNKDGLGYWFVLEWLNIHGNLKIGIPNRDYYMGKYCMEGNRKYLKENYGGNENG